MKQQENCWSMPNNPQTHSRLGSPSSAPFPKPCLASWEVSQVFHVTSAFFLGYVWGLCFQKHFITETFKYPPMYKDWMHGPTCTNSQLPTSIKPWLILFHLSPKSPHTHRHCTVSKKTPASCHFVCKYSKRSVVFKDKSIVLLP